MKNRNQKFKIGEICRLSELGINRRAVIEKIEIQNYAIYRRIVEMGITSGSIVEIKKIAPLGDPVGLLIRGYELCVRKSELKNIIARVVKWK